MTHRKRKNDHRALFRLRTLLVFACAGAMIYIWRCSSTVLGSWCVPPPPEVHISPVIAENPVQLEASTYEVHDTFFRPLRIILCRFYLADQNRALDVLMEGNHRWLNEKAKIEWQVRRSSQSMSANQIIINVRAALLLLFGGFVQLCNIVHISV